MRLEEAQSSARPRRARSRPFLLLPQASTASRRGPRQSAHPHHHHAHPVARGPRRKAIGSLGRDRAEWPPAQVRSSPFGSVPFCWPSQTDGRTGEQTERQTGAERTNSCARRAERVEPQLAGCCCQKWPLASRLPVKMFQQSAGLRRERKSKRKSGPKLARSANYDSSSQIYSGPPAARRGRASLVGAHSDNSTNSLRPPGERPTLMPQSLMGRPGSAAGRQPVSERVGKPLRSSRLAGTKRASERAHLSCK